MREEPAYVIFRETFMKSFGSEFSDDDKRLPYVPKLLKSPVKHRLIAGSSKCTKNLSSFKKYQRYKRLKRRTT